MNNKRTWIEKLGDFISGKGFYLVVLICVAAIALSGYYLVRGVRDGLDETLDQPVSGSAAIRDSSAPSAAPSAQPSARPSNPPASSSARISAPPAPSALPEPSAIPSAAPSSAPTPSPAPAPLVFTWPVKGTVTTGYSVEALAYNPTMGDWRTHSGVDIDVTLGTHVLAAASGTVSDIHEDDLLGTVVCIDHGQGLVSWYANLAAVPTVAVGDAVSTGAVIGSVGQTAAGESSQPAHLHFALFQDEQPVDPCDYLP